MKITKLKNGKYKVGDIITYDEVIIKLNLLNEINIDIEKIYEENKYFEEYFKILKMIERKKRTKKEIDNILVNKNILTELENKGYIDDKKYVIAYLHDKLLLTNYGPLKLKYNLLKLGIDEELVNEELNKIDKSIFLNKLDKLNNKSINYLVNQGYDIEDIKKKRNN